MARPREISKQTITRAINSLLKWLRSKKKQNQDDIFIYLILTLKKTPHRGRHLSFPIPIPHPIHSQTTLLFDDRGTHSLSSLSSLSLPVDNIIPFSEIRAIGETPSGLLLVDRRIVKLLPKKKGSNGASVVEVVDMGKKSWPEAVKRRVGSTVMSFRGGTCCGIRAGSAGMSVEEIVENVAAAVDRVVENVPKKWGSVRGFHVKAAESVALPIYDAAAVEVNRRSGMIESHEKIREDKRIKLGA